MSQVQNKNIATCLEGKLKKKLTDHIRKQIYIKVSCLESVICSQSLHYLHVKRTGATPPWLVPTIRSRKHSCGGHSNLNWLQQNRMEPQMVFNVYTEDIQLIPVVLRRSYLRLHKNDFRKAKAVQTQRAPLTSVFGLIRSQWNHGPEKYPIVWWSLLLSVII